MFRRCHFAAILVLSAITAATFGATSVATSGEAVPGALVNEPTIQLAQVYSACKDCVNHCLKNYGYCMQRVHTSAGQHRCLFLRNRCVRGCYSQGYCHGSMGPPID